ncbi:hypothetical protein HZS_5797 [Henneguya salminicola]|nr:hypothetical protein HZS_5797 [Henneguya salminicola]
MVSIKDFFFVLKTKKTLDLCSAISHLISHNIKEMIKYSGAPFLRNSKELIEMVDRLNLCKIGDLVGVPGLAYHVKLLWVN